MSEALEKCPLKSPPRPRLVLPVCLAQSCSSSCPAPVSLFYCALGLEVQKEPSHGRKDHSADSEHGWPLSVAGAGPLTACTLENRVELQTIYRHFPAMV